MAGWLTPRIVNEAAKGSTPLRGREKGSFSVLPGVLSATLEKLLREGRSAYGLFRAHRYHLELNSPAPAQTRHCLYRLRVHSTH